MYSNYPDNFNPRELDNGPDEFAVYFDGDFFGDDVSYAVQFMGDVHGKILAVGYARINGALLASEILELPNVQAELVGAVQAYYDNLNSDPY